MASQSSDLPPGWIIHTSKSTGKQYYFNTVTNQSSYERPALPSASSVASTPSGHASGWVIATSSKTGKQYYFNAATNESRYDPPPGFVAPASVATSANYVSVASSSSAGVHAGMYGTSGTAGWAHGNTEQSYPSYNPPVQESHHDMHDDAQPGHKRARAADDDYAGGLGSGSALSSSSSYYGHSADAVRSSANAGRDTDVAMAVASAYDNLTDRGREGRQQSNILHLKNFNNWVKATLVRTFAPQPCTRVLDLACGKLGDLQKWRKAGVKKYCGVDISRQAVEDAATRFNDSCAGSGITAKIVRADLGCFDLTATGVLAPGEQFDAISIQFALHYLFQTEARALNFFQNIADRLAPGGVFVGTIPDAAVLVRRLRDLPPDETAWGNSIYSVEFTKASKDAQWAIGGHPYGIKYRFFLAESVDHVDEYLVPWQLLERLAASVGLKPLAHDNFHVWFERMTAEGNLEARQLLHKMKVLDAEGTLSPEEWEVAGVYRVFAFQMPHAGEDSPAAPVRLAPGASLLPTGDQSQDAGAGDALSSSAAKRAPPGFSYKSLIQAADLVDLIG